MANRDYPMGFVPLRYQNGSPLAVEEGLTAATHDAMFENDLLERRTDGYIHPAQATSITLIGVAAHYKAAESGGSEGKITYYPLEGLLMKAQANEDDINIQDDFELSYDILPTAGSTTTGMSAMEIESTGGSSSATLPIKILRVHAVKGDPDGNALGTNVVLECMANAGVTKGAGLAG